MKLRNLVFVVLVGCAGMDRDCSSCTATAFGGDWIVVQQTLTGEPYNCWTLRGTGVSNENHSDGIYWKDETTGTLVHIAGQYARVQVQGGRFKEAARLLGVDESACVGGHYLNPGTPMVAPRLGQVGSGNVNTGGGN